MAIRRRQGSPSQLQCTGLMQQERRSAQRTLCDAHLCCSSLVPGKLRSMYCSPVSARSRPSTWCWLNVASRTWQRHQGQGLDGVIIRVRVRARMIVADSRHASDAPEQAQADDKFTSSRLSYRGDAITLPRYVKVHHRAQLIKLSLVGCTAGLNVARRSCDAASVLQAVCFSVCIVGLAAQLPQSRILVVCMSCADALQMTSITRTFGFRVMVPFVGSRLPPIRLSSVDFPMPAGKKSTFAMDRGMRGQQGPTGPLARLLHYAIFVTRESLHSGCHWLLAP